MTILYSVVIPAFNEEKFLAATLSSLKEAMNSLADAGEIIVVDNNSNDATSEIARDLKVQVVFEPINQISRARNAGARVAKGQYLIFLDADTIINPVLLETAINNLSSRQCCGGGVIVTGDEATHSGVQTFINTWNAISVKYQLAAGCFIYCLREGFDAVDGFNEKVYASEEIWFSRQLNSWGKKRGLEFSIITDPPIVSSVRKAKWYPMWQVYLYTLPVLVFPPLLRSRTFCHFWYRRPE